MKTATVSQEFANKFATEKETPYTRWVRDEGLDIISSFYVENLHTAELKPWPRRGGKGVYLNHDASRTSNDCYVCEIPAGKSLTPQRQLYEEMIYVPIGNCEMWLFIEPLAIEKRVWPPPARTSSCYRAKASA
jgi:hypothetical protein